MMELKEFNSCFAGGCATCVEHRRAASFWLVNLNYRTKLRGKQYLAFLRLCDVYTTDEMSNTDFTDKETTETTDC